MHALIYIYAYPPVIFQQVPSLHLQVVRSVRHEAVPGIFQPGCSGLWIMVAGE